MLLTLLGTWLTRGDWCLTFVLVKLNEKLSQKVIDVKDCNKNLGANYVFLGGVPRSGTTLLQRIMGAHPDFYAGPEFDFIPGGLMNLRHQMRKAIESGRISQIVDEPTLDKAFRRFLSGIFQKKLAREGKSLFCEKTPASALHFQDLERIFPESSFIAVIRDPRDVANSMKMVKRKTIAKGVRPPRFVRSVTASIEEMNRFFEAIDESCANSSRVHLVHYEDVLSDPEREVRRICRLLEIDFSERMLDIDSSDWQMPRNSDDFWYSQEHLKTGIQKSGVISDFILNTAEIKLVERFVEDFDFLHRYDLRSCSANAMDKLNWHLGKVQKAGLFMPKRKL